MHMCLQLHTQVSACLYIDIHIHLWWCLTQSLSTFFGWVYDMCGFMVCVCFHVCVRERRVCIRVCLCV